MNDQANESRWRHHLGITLALFAAFVLLFPATICGCHFHTEALFPPILPIVWGLYALASYRDRKEQLVGWFAFALALLSVWAEIDGNLIYAF